MNAALPKLKPMSRRSVPAREEAAYGLERRRELGQFFTSAEVVGFIWDLLEVIHGRGFPAGTRLIDPACGEGVFLRVAHKRGGLPVSCLFGADIDGALAPGWQQDPLLRGANLLLANGLLDDPQTGSLSPIGRQRVRSTLHGPKCATRFAASPPQPLKWSSPSDLCVWPSPVD